MIVKKGTWVTYCCHLDLYQLEEDEEFDDDIKPQCYSTEKQALEEILLSWKRSHNTIKNDCSRAIIECEKMLKDI